MMMLPLQQLNCFSPDGHAPAPQAGAAASAAPGSIANAPAHTRFAPSPSGHLHVGGARTALFCWAFARKHADGRFILRIEDTDQRRSSQAASSAFLEDLLWLGIHWDEGPVYAGVGGGDKGPYYQSERLAIYKEHLQRLIEAGRAYPAFETAEQLDAARADARAKKQNYRYDRASLELPKAVVEKYLAEGRPHVIRFRVPDDQPITIRDEILGEVTLPPDSLDDFVILKADGYPTYHFAVVVDDALMGVTHVLRAQEHFNNTAKHLLLQEALGFPTPVYGHLPIIMNPDGSKMSKRDKDKALRRAVKEQQITSPPADTIDQATFDAWLADKDRQLDVEVAGRMADAIGVTLPEINVDDFRRSGYLPSVLINFLALNGWNPGEDIEKFDADFFVERFAFDRVQKTPAKFDRDKLLAFNLDALQQMPPDQFADLYRKHAAQY
ncbi:MAG: glutamate--tRNA ligase, partial [Planctomycetota bacterium]